MDLLHYLQRGRDFAQLSGNTRDTKYNASMEQIASIIDQYCTFPTVEKAKLFKLTLFNFIVGNEDAHLKNFSTITRKDGTVTLSPCYDLVNSTIAMNTTEQMALTLKGKKRNIPKTYLLDYFGKERLGLNNKVIEKTLAAISEKFPLWNQLIDNSFLKEELKEAYKDLLTVRTNVLELKNST